MIPPLNDPDMAITIFLDVIAPKWLSALTYVAIVAAIMSTADTFCNVGAAVLTRDLPRIAGYAVHRQLFWGRTSSGLLFGLALLFAIRTESLVAYLGIFAFGSLAAVFSPVLAIGLNWERAGFWAARSSMLLGIFCSIGLELTDRFGLYNLQVSPSALSLTLSLLTFLLVGAASAPGSRVRRTPGADPLVSGV